MLHIQKRFFTNSKIDVANHGLFILSHVYVPPKQWVALMSFVVLFIINFITWILLNTNISFPCIICGWTIMLLKTSIGNNCYIDGRPRTHGNITGFIISCRSSLFSATCSFEEYSNDKEFFMKKNASRFVVVYATRSLSPGDELLINYNFPRPPIVRQKCLALGLPLYVPLGRKKNIIE